MFLFFMYIIPFKLDYKNQLFKKMEFPWVLLVMIISHLWNLDKK